MRFFYTTLLVLGAILLAPNFVFADMPSECPAGVYNPVTDADGTSGDDFITVSAGNLINIDAKGGNDCIVVGSGNTKTISGGSDNDVIIVGDNNDGNIDGNGGADVLIIGNGNKKKISGGDGTDTITVGDNNLGDVEGNGDSDIISVGVGNQGKVSGGGGEDEITVGDNNDGEVSGEGNDDLINIGKGNSGHIKGGGGNDTVVMGENNAGLITTEGGDDTITVGCGHNSEVDGGGGNDVIKTSCLPVASPVSGIFTSIQSISLASETGASIYYTTDGSLPACLPSAGTLYEAPISVFSTKTIKAISCSSQDLVSDVATFTYTIEEIETDTEDMSSLVDLFVSTASASGVTVTQNLKINVSADSGNSQVVLEKDTEITRSDEQTVNASSLTSSQANINTLSGLTQGKVFQAALQWGIPTATLQFSKPITIKIFVGTDLNGQTLDVMRSPGGDEWTSEGIVAPATCVVADGICSFRANKASFYAALGNAPVSAPAGAVGLAFVNSGAGTLPSPAPVLPIQPEQSPVAESRILDLSAPIKSAGQIGTKKQVVAKTVEPKITTKIQPTPEPTPVIEVEQKLKPEKKNVLTTFFASILSLLLWPF